MFGVMIGRQETICGNSQLEEVQERKEHMGGKLNLDCRETHICNLY